MSWPALVMWVVVFAIGVPSAIGLWWRTWTIDPLNPTAAALVIAQLATSWWGFMTGDNLPLEIYPFTDILIIAVIAAKCPHSFLDCSPADRAVLLIFPMMWPFYVAPIDEFYIWWFLWGATILQFLFASSESLEQFWRTRTVSKSLLSIIDRHLVVIPLRRDAEAVRKPPLYSGALLTAGGGGSG